MSGPYDPGSLPEVSSAEVVSLRGVEPGRDHPLADAGSAPTFAVGEDEARRLADLWRRLPSGEQSRCHFPAFGLRFFAGGRPACEASICWGCDNAWVHAGGARLVYEFDSRAEVSQQLLAELRRIAGEPAEA